MMSNIRYTVAIPDPCNEDWDKMTLAACGRHCDACRKTVIDFSLLSDGEIIDLLKKEKNKPLCGHFLNTQLNRELVDTRYKPSLTSVLARRIAAAVILFQSVAVSAQQVKGKVAAAYHNSNKKKPVKNTIRGRVIDVATGEPMQGIKVKVSAAGIESLTDKAGRFSMILPADTVAKTIVIVGYPDYQAATEKDSFFIMEQLVTPVEIAAGNEIILYRYPAEILPEHKIATYKKPLVSQYSSYGGAMTVTEIKRAPTVTYYTFHDRLYNTWYKITKPFRKRVHHNGE